jgi:hypothetical protein
MHLIGVAAEQSFARPAEFDVPSQMEERILVPDSDSILKSSTGRVQFHKFPIGEISVGLAASEEDEELLNASEADVERSEDRAANPER